MGRPPLPSVKVSLELSFPPLVSLPPPSVGQLSLSSAPSQLGAGIFRNTLEISIGQKLPVVQLASLVKLVKFPNWLTWVTNVSQGSLIVSVGHMGMYMQYRNKHKRYAYGQDNQCALALARSFPWL